MLDGKRVLAIIPARVGSKRLPRKNVLPLCGKPLIAWSIEAAIETQIFDEVMVNTDDEDIAVIAEQHGAKVPFMRPRELATDTASSLDVIKYTLQWYKERGENFTEVVLLQPTSPLRSSLDINKAYKTFLDKKASSVFSVCELDHPTKWCNTLNESLSMDDFLDKAEKKTRSQDFDKEYRLNGAIYIWDVNKFLSANSMIIPPAFATVMDRIRSIDIDERIDFDIAEMLVRKLK